MKISNIAVASLLALAACGADDHDDYERVAWQVTTASAGTRAAIEGGELVLEADGPGPGLLPPLNEAALQIGTELQAGDFEIRLAGVSLAGTTGVVGMLIGADDNWAASFFEMDGEGTGTVHAVVEGPGEYHGDHKLYPAGGDAEADLFLSRDGDVVEARSTSDDHDAVQTFALGSSPVVLTVFLQPSPGVAADQTVRATLARREVDDNAGPFDLDIIEE